MRRAKALAVTLLLGAGIAVAADAATVQHQGLRITVLSQVKPYKLPRTGTAPIAVFVSGHLENAQGGIPPQLQRMRIEVNRRGLLQSRGLSVCPLARIQPSSTERALSVCGDALVGSGRFWARIVLPGQEPYPTQGRLLVFNGEKGGKPALFAHIYTRNPFNASFVVAFEIRKISKGHYGTELTASLPESLGEWGYVDRIKLTLKRKYTYEGRQLSYFNAGCPAPQGTSRAAFSLARVNFSFAGRPSLTANVSKACGVSEG